MIRKLRLQVSLVALLLLQSCTLLSKNPTQPLLLLGEVHDNQDGHQARLVQLHRLIQRGLRPSIVMEQFDRDRQNALNQSQANCKDAKCVIESAGGKGWDWPLYEPLIELALKHKLPIIAGNIARNDIGKVMKDGLSAIFTEQEVTQFQLRAVIPENVLKEQRQAIATGHCDLLPPSMIGPMTNVQFAKDVWMAQAMIQHAKNGVILIAGNGHIRKDIGVPYWLRRAQKTDYFSEGFVEETSSASNAYQQSLYEKTNFLKPFNRPDPCEEFKRMFNRGK